MASLKGGIFIVAAKRTAIGRKNGKLRKFMDYELASEAVASALNTFNERPKLDGVICGNTQPNQKVKSSQYPCPVQMMCQKVGISNRIPAFNVNRQSASGIQAVVCGAQEMDLWKRQLLLCVGVDVSSNNIETTYMKQRNDGDVVRANHLATLFNIDKEACDGYVLNSARRWELASAFGDFCNEIAPVGVNLDGNISVFDFDEHELWNSNAYKLDKASCLRPAVPYGPNVSQSSVVTAFHCAKNADGAAAVVLASEEAVNTNNWTPLARISRFDITGCHSPHDGLGAAESIKSLLKKEGKRLEDIDLFEIHEDLAPVVLATQHSLQLESTRLNSCGGAIGMGDARGASGIRMIGHLSHMLAKMTQNDKRPTKHFGVASANIFYNQGISVLLESV